MPDTTPAADNPPADNLGPSDRVDSALPDSDALLSDTGARIEASDYPTCWGARLLVRGWPDWTPPAWMVERARRVLTVTADTCEAR